MLNSKFDVSVQKLGNIYRATCSLFPGTTGVGSSEEEALDDLANIIMYRVGDVLDNSIEDYLTLKKPDEPSVAKSKKKIKDLKDEVFSAKTMESFNLNLGTNLTNTLFNNASLTPVTNNKPFNFQLDDFSQDGVKAHHAPFSKNAMFFLSFRRNSSSSTSSKSGGRKISEIIESLSGNYNNFITGEPESLAVPEGVLLGIPVSYN